MKVRNNFTLAAMVILLLCGQEISSVSANTYYVATTGSDSNPGTFDLPWLTIGKAAGLMVAGDTTYIRGGTYNIPAAITPTNSGSAGNYITFAAYQGEIPILDNGGLAIRTFTLDSSHSYFRFIGLTMQNYAAGGGILVDSFNTATQPNRAHHIEIFNCTIQNALLTSIKLRSVHDIIIAGCSAANCKGGYELKTYDPNATVNTGYDFNTENVQIIDCHVQNMHINSSTDNDGITGGGTYNSTEQLMTSWCENIYVSGFSANICWDDGIDIRGRYVTLDHCTVSNVYNKFSTVDGHGYKFYAVDVPVDPNRYHCEFIKCLSYNNNREGFKLTSLMDDEPGYNGSPRYIKQMRMINCTSAHDNHGICLVTNSTHRMNITVKNCIVADANRAWEITGNPVIWAPPPPQSGPVMAPSLPSYLTLDSNYNLWYADFAVPITYLGSNYSLVGWQSISGQDFNSISASAVFDANYHPTNPACIDSGVDVGLPYAGSAPDMGFFESEMVDVNCPANYLTMGENWISIPIAAENDGPYSVFKDLGTWPNCVYLNLYRYDSPTAGLVQYPTYQSDPVQFRKITSGGVYKLMLGGAQPTIHVSGVPVNGTQTLTIGGTGTRDFYFGDPFNRPLYKSHCKIKKGTTDVSIDQAISNGWIGNVQHFNPVTKSWEAIGNILQAWHGYKLTAYTAGALQLNIYDLPTSDLDGSGQVNYADLALLVNDWLVYDSNVPLGDLNGDNYVEFHDFAILAQNWVNYPPTVNAGTDQTIINPVNSVNLTGTVTDDGLPNPPGQVTATWTVTSGPGTVVFDDTNAAATTATFSAYGTYVLRLTVSDSDLSAYDEVAITYLETAPVNQAPTVNAGTDQTINLPASANLSGTITDDGLPNPPAAVATAWTKQSGPGTVTFGNANAAVTTASFSTTGTYVLRLTANDSVLANFDEVTITVNQANQAPTVNAGTDQTITSPASATLSGTVSDDGFPNPPGAVTVTWTKTSGPGTVTFGNTNAAVTTASFSVDGVYVLRLTADDSAIQTYDEVTITVNPSAATFLSVDAKDGWVRESTETSGVGGGYATSATYLGDTATNQQYIGVLSFDTSSIPDGATITSATISIRRLGAYGTPTSLGTITVDIKNGFYGTSDSLAAADFEAASSATNVTTLPYPAANGDWVSGVLNSSGRSNINKTGVTQFKIRFTLDDDNDSAADYLSIYDSGDPPKLEITWQ